MRRALRQPWWTLPVIGLVATHELYTYTVPGTPWTDHEYLTQLLFYGLHRIGGLLAVSIVFGAITWAGFWLIYARIRQMAYAPAIAGIDLFLGAAAGFPLWGPRPQMFDVLFISVELFLIERFLRVRSRAIYLLPVAVLVWANFHGGFVFSFFFLGITIFALLVRWLLERDRGLLIGARDLAAVTVLCGIASLITPYGPALFVYVWRTQFSSQLSGFVLESASTRANYPVAAADWLAAHPNVGTRLFNEYSWGGYIAYRFYPDQNRRVFIYGESELVGDTLLSQYADVNQLHPDWEHVLDEHGVDYARG